jgi:hypothetical protein
MADVETDCAAKRQKMDGDVGGGDDAMSVTTAGEAPLSSVASTSDVGSEASSMADAETALLSKLIDDCECPIDLDAFSTSSFERGLEAPADEAINADSDVIRTSLNKTDSKMFTAFTEALKTGLDTQSHLGKLFRDAHGKGTAAGDEYSKMSRADCAKFRVDWAAKSFSKFKEEKTFAKSWKRIDLQRGDYLNFDQLIGDQGGVQSRAAVQGAINLTRKCLRMGPPWVKRHPQTERVMFLRLHFAFSEEFEQCWSSYKREFDDTKGIETDVGQAANAAAAAPAAAPAAIVDGPADRHVPKDASRSTKPPASAPSRNAKARARNGGATDKPTISAEAKAFGILVAKTQKIKAMILVNTTVGMELATQIKCDDDWIWARNDQNLGKLELMLRTLSNSITEFGRKILTQDMAEIKKGYSMDFLATPLAHFCEQASGFGDLSKLMSQLRKRHVQ